MAEGNNNTFFNPEASKPASRSIIDRFKGAFRTEPPVNLAAEVEKRNIDAIRQQDPSGNLTQEQAEMRMAARLQSANTSNALPYNEQNVERTMVAESVASKYGLTPEDIQTVRENGMPVGDVEAWASMLQARRIREKQAADRANYVPSPNASNQMLQERQAARIDQDASNAALNTLEPSFKVRTQDELNKMQHVSETTGLAGVPTQADIELAQARAANARISEQQNIPRVNYVPQVGHDPQQRPTYVVQENYPVQAQQEIVTEEITESPEGPFQETPSPDVAVASSPFVDQPVISRVDTVATMVEPGAIEERSNQITDREEGLDTNAAWIQDDQPRIDDNEESASSVDNRPIEINLFQNEPELRKYAGLSVEAAFYSRRMDEIRKSFIEQGKLKKVKGTGTYSEVGENNVEIDGQQYHISMQSSVEATNRPTYSDAVSSVQEIWFVDASDNAELYLLSLKGELYKGKAKLEKQSDGSYGYAKGTLPVIESTPLNPTAGFGELNSRLSTLNKATTIAA